MKTRTKTVEELRAEAADHARQIESVHWLSVNDLRARWAVSAVVIRQIPREKLPYITLGETSIRRYRPDDVERFEAEERKAPEAQAS
jgi:hypothetical protein